MADVQVDEVQYLKALDRMRVRRIAELEQSVALQEVLLLQRDERIAELDGLVEAVTDGGLKAGTP